MGKPSYKSKVKYPNYIPQDFAYLDSQAQAADSMAYQRSDSDFANRHAGVVGAEKLFEKSVSDDQTGDTTLAPAIQSEFMRAGLQSSLGAFGDTPGTLTPGSAGEASVARNLGLRIGDFQDRNRRNRERSLGLAEDIFQRRKFGLTGEDAAVVAASNNVNVNNYRQGKFQSDVQKEQFKYNDKLAKYNAWQASQNAGAAGDAAETDAMIQGGAAIAGLALLLLMCWVARAAYGEESNNWRLFRSWLLSDDAPLWLFNFYFNHGEKIGSWIKRNQWSRPAFRFVMDFAVNKVKKEQAKNATPFNSAQLNSAQLKCAN